MERNVRIDKAGIEFFSAGVCTTEKLSDFMYEFRVAKEFQANVIHNVVVNVAPWSLKKRFYIIWLIKIVKNFMILVTYQKCGKSTSGVKGDSL